MLPLFFVLEDPLVVNPRRTGDGFFVDCGPFTAKDTRNDSERRPGPFAAVVGFQTTGNRIEPLTKPVEGSQRAQTGHLSQVEPQALQHRNRPATPGRGGHPLEGSREIAKHSPLNRLLLGDLWPLIDRGRQFRKRFQRRSLLNDDAKLLKHRSPRRRGLTRQLALQASQEREQVVCGHHAQHFVGGTFLRVGLDRQ